jgi:hypothetical protein
MGTVANEYHSGSPSNRPRRSRGGVDVWLYSFFNLGARWEWVVNATPRLLYPRERPGTHCIGGSVWTGAENLVPTGIRSPDRPVRSESPSGYTIIINYVCGYKC